MSKSFWTKPRLEAVSKMLLTLAQAYLIAFGASNVFEKLTSWEAKLLYVGVIVILTAAGIVVAGLKGKEV